MQISSASVKDLKVHISRVLEPSVANIFFLGASKFKTSVRFFEMASRALIDADWSTLVKSDWPCFYVRWVYVYLYFIKAIVSQ